MKHWTGPLKYGAAPEEWFMLINSTFSNSNEERELGAKPKVVINNLEHGVKKNDPDFKDLANRSPIDHSQEVQSCSHCGKNNHSIERCLS